MKRFSLLFLVFAGLALMTGCGGGTPAPQVAAVPEIEAMALAKAFEADEQKAKADYNGKTYVVKNLLIYSTDNEQNQLSCNAYDPTSKAVSVASIRPKLNDQPLATGSEFGIEIFPAEPKTADKFKGSTNTGQGDDRFTVYTEVISAEGTIEYTDGSGNTFNVRKAKIK